VPTHLRNGDKYWTLADWTGKGKLSPVETIWRGDHIDRARQSKGLVFQTKLQASKALSKPKLTLTEKP